MELILGSASPRRKKLLKEMGFNFKVIIPDVAEVYSPDLETEYVAPFLAQLKANYLKSGLDRDQLLICCDTVVIYKDEILGKPNDSRDAFRTLTKLSGKKHYVMSAVCMVINDKMIEFKETTSIEFKTLSNTEIEHYIKNHKPFDKAGSYGIQEWLGHIGVSSIQGSYTNVMGLPTQRLYLEIMKLSN
jgi:septum formation protein